jgi:hypothetical protein
MLTRASASLRRVLASVGRRGPDLDGSVQKHAAVSAVVSDEIERGNAVVIAGV